MAPDLNSVSSSLLVPIWTERWLAATSTPFPHCEKGQASLMRSMTLTSVAVLNMVRSSSHA
jgi:hypothetical protein